MECDCAVRPDSERLHPLRTKHNTLEQIEENTVHPTRPDYSKLNLESTDNLINIRYALLTVNVPDVN